MLSGCCSSPKERTIKFEGIENARELGGLVMQDGRTIRAGKLVRSAELSKATDADVALLKSRFDLSDIFDFRFDAERSKALDREIEGVSNTWLSTLPQAFVAAFSSGRADSTVVQSANLLETLSSYAFNPKAQEMAQKLYPAMPFRYAMDAMRECVAGMYGYSYAKCMGALALFTLGAVAFGLALYWPAKWLNRLINESKARSEIML